MMDSHREAFREEARELLGELEAALLELEQTPTDEELIGRVFRAMHTIKGSGAMFGFDDIAGFTHDVETVYDLVRGGKIPVTKPLIDLTLAACDEIRGMVDPAEGLPGDRQDQVTQLVQSFKGILQAYGKPNPAGAPPPSPAPATPAAPKAGSATYRIRFRPAPDLFLSGTNPIPLLNELRELGRCSVTAHLEAIPPLAAIDPEVCFTAWDIILTTQRGVNAIRDVFIFVEDACELLIDEIDPGEGVQDAPPEKKLGEILVERGDLSEAQIDLALGNRKRIGELLVESGLVTPGKVESALAEQQHIRELQRKRQGTESAASIRVPAEKLDSLVNMVGELVTVQSRLSQLAAERDDLALLQVAEEVERLMAELRDNTMGIRMLPIGSTFSKFQRLVRDLSADLGKEILLVTEGGETELDKTVIEKLNDPLVHLIRNCIDHGIEKPDRRREAGKPAQGTVRLTAEHAGANVVIRIIDDGAGLDREAIRGKAVERGMVAADAVLTEKELYALILAPGFSTARTLTSVSGRGVGMDVVKKGIEALQGSIEIGSQMGTGTTITLKLPLTLAIIDGLLVRVDTAHFIMPLAAIEECIELTREEIARAHGQRLVNIRGEIVPYVRLRERFKIDTPLPEIEQVVTTKVEGRKVGFAVDQVIGGHQTVIKTLGRVYRNVDDVSGATILGDGQVALILDLAKLTQSVEAETAAARRTGGY